MTMQVQNSQENRIHTGVNLQYPRQGYIQMQRLHLKEEIITGIHQMSFLTEGRIFIVLVQYFHLVKSTLKSFLHKFHHTYR